LANGHPNIIRLHRVTKLDLDKKEWSLVLECANGGPLRDNLRNNIIEWNNQLKFAKEIASAIYGYT
jgi:serine/threonine protein kinase